MVGKRRHSASPSGTKRSPVLNVEPALANRPRRNISPKNLDLNAGLSWREERELKKALYASLQEVKRPSSQPDTESPLDYNKAPCSSSSLGKTHHGDTQTREPHTDKNTKNDAVSSRTRRQSSRQPVTLGQITSNKVTPLKANQKISVLDENSQDSVRSTASTATQESIKKDEERKKYRAQRKFAQSQGYSPSSTPTHTPVKLISKAASPMKLFPKRAKTEDFLTFLCLRGTGILPPHLDFFNYSRDDGDSSYPATPSNGRPGSAMRESSPSSSSTGGSNTQEEGFDQPVVTPVPKLITPNRKAARACAGTPEIARGLAGASPRSTKNSHKASLLARRGPGVSQVTPSKSTRSMPSPKKLSPLRKHGIKSLSKHADRISRKRKAVATLTEAKLSPKKLRKKTHLFDEDGSDEMVYSVLPEIEKKTVKRKYERKIQSKRKQEIKKVRKQKKEGKSNEGFIASRLPKRNASKRVFKLYMELDDIDDSLDRQRKVGKSKFLRNKPRLAKLRQRYTEETAIVDDLGDNFIDFDRLNDEKTQCRRNRKTTEYFNFDSEDSEISFPLKEKQVKSGYKNKNFRQKKFKHLKKDLNSTKIDKNVLNTSPRMNTRSTSSSSGIGLPQISVKNVTSTKICASKKLNKIKSLKNRVKYSEKGQLNDFLMKKKMKRKSTAMKKDILDRKNSAILFSKKKKGISEKCDKGKTKMNTVKIEPFPALDDQAQIVDIPTYYPTEDEFRDPIQYIQQISTTAQPYGMCKIVPPASWKPDSKVNEDMRFITQKQYIHKLYHRFGPNVQQLESIKKHLESHGVAEPMPVIGGVEVDLCKLSATIQEFGGMQNVMEKKKWLKVADAMKIPKTAQDRGTKLYDAYCKFLLSYDTMSPEEKLHIEELVKIERIKVKREGLEDECIVKGKNMPLMSFSRTARNTLSVWFKDDLPKAEQVETEFWKIVKNRSDHVVVHGGHLDSHTHHCSMFPSRRDNHYSRHPWNLNNLPYNPSSVLKYLGPVSGISVPTLHVGMLFTASCWSTDVHFLPYVQYLHSESDIIWYSIPKEEEVKFQSAMKELVPTLMKGDERWLKEDTVIVPPQDLVQKGVSIGRCVQQPHQFVVVFPKCYTATVSCGYTLAESVHFAKSNWIQQGVMAAQELHRCREQELFSMDELLCHMVQDSSLSMADLDLVFPAFQQMIDEELHLRKQLHEAGLKVSKKMCTSSEMPSRSSPNHSRKSVNDVEEIVTICDVSKKICYLSMVLNETDDLAFSLEEGLSHVQKKRNIKSCKLLYRHTEDELKKMLSDAKERLNIGSDKLGRRYSKSRSEDVVKS